MTKPTREARLRVAAVMAVIGIVLFATVLYDDVPSNSEARTGLVIRYALAMALGGALAGYLLARLFGRTGVVGWVLAVFGGGLASIVAGLAGSLIGLLPELLSDGWHSTDMIAIASGILILPFALNDGLFVALVWIGLVLGAHIWARSQKG